MFWIAVIASSAITCGCTLAYDKTKNKLYYEIAMLLGWGVPIAFVVYGIICIFIGEIIETILAILIGFAIFGVNSRFLDIIEVSDKVSVTCPYCGGAHDEPSKSAKYCLCPDCGRAFGDESLVTERIRNKVKKEENDSRAAEEFFRKNDVGSKAAQIVLSGKYTVRVGSLPIGSLYIDKYGLNVDGFEIDGLSYKRDARKAKKIQSFSHSDVYSTAFFKRLGTLCEEYCDSMGVNIRVTTVSSYLVRLSWGASKHH